ncbi:uncharacterized protein LOC124453357 isoform X3 [Xenia sp. Carnegie-2017]|uniref:uncharacterized protein LOC124453357 isoform X3 n=1 Tax=Xenia sp. Carnegie-2017 TaxID=2897299 RepID=UPI001F03A9C0|nr:uncharacterized protein LOC124453357 isoform X3 [Xenia sp. Carnegie-2017]
MEELKSEQEVMIERLLTEQKSKLKREEAVAVKKVKGRHAEDIKMIKEEHRKELNALRCEFEAFAAEAEQYKILALESENLKEDMRDLQQLHEKTEQKLRKTLNELADVKLKLQGYEMSFSEKVAEVEERYAMKIQRLILNNTDLRHNYMKKCAELLGVQNKDNTTTNSKAMKVSNTKEQ